MPPVIWLSTRALFSLSRVGGKISTQASNGTGTLAVGLGFTVTVMVWVLAQGNREALGVKV